MGSRRRRLRPALAGHFERGHDAARAVRYRQLAAAQALGRYAYPEAVSHLTQGLALLAQFPRPWRGRGGSWTCSSPWGRR